MKASLIKVLLAVMFAFAANSYANDNIMLYTNSDDAQVNFAISEIDNVLPVRVIDEMAAAQIVIVIDNTLKGVAEEGFIIEKGEWVSIKASSAAGAMYGGLELAEQIKLYTWEGIQAVAHNPYMDLRGTKFNIPLDVRTPSYSDMSDAAQHNIAEMWSIDFWKEYIDQMARYRYNFISLWSLHPFPSMVKVPGYEDVALDNVERSTAKKKEYYSLMGIGLNEGTILDSTEVLKKITIEEKMDFWREVMAYGKSRNVDFFLVTWNIFVYGTEGKYGITNKIDNEITRDYFRKSVAQMFETYPDLAGIGLTAGENMHGSNFQQKEAWAFETYAQGTMDAARAMPERQFTFLHRQHMTGAKDVAAFFKELIDEPNIDFLYSFKYAKAHVYSATKQPYHQKFVKDIEGMKTIWTLRNDDIYYFRWGAPDYVREFIKNIPYEVSKGYYYGSDQWIWGRDFLSKSSTNTRQLEVNKHWYHWMLWGRLGYDPEMSNERLQVMLQQRYSDVDGQQLFTAWQEASMVYPVTTGFHWGALDFKWYIEGCRSAPKQADRPSGFHGVDMFIDLPPHECAGYQSIPDYVTMLKDNGETALKTPLEVAELLHGHCDTALSIIATMVTDNDELALTLNDITCISYLGKYYAHKIAGATYVAQYRATKDKTIQQKAISELEYALTFWKRYTQQAKQHYQNPIWTNRVGHVDWEKMTQDVVQDIEVAREG